MPSPLVCIVALTAAAVAFGFDVRTVGDMGELPDRLPTFLWPDVPMTLETLRIIVPYAATLTVVGLLESMMTASIVDTSPTRPATSNASASVRAPPTLPPDSSAAWPAAR